MATIRRRTWTNPNGRTRTAWQARYVGPDGRRHTRQFAKKSAAQDWVDSEKSRMLGGEWSDPRATKRPFREWYAEWNAGRLNLEASSLARDDSYAANHILPHFGATPLSHITTEAVKAWVKRLEADGLAPATIRKAKQLLAASLEASPLPANPARKVQTPKLKDTEKHFLDHPKIGTLIEAMPPRYRTLVSTGAFTGLRWGELAGLRVKHLDLLRRRLTVAEAATEVAGKIEFKEPKTKASKRTVTLPRFLCDELAAHLAANPASHDELVFRSLEGGPLRRTNFRRRVWLPAVAATGLDGLRFHDLRHTHAALLIAQGEHPKVIQSRLGHKSIRTTLDTYGHLFDGLDADAADRLDAAFVDAGWHKSGTKAQ